MQEKRKYKRLKQAINIRHCRENEDVIEHAVAKDICTGGIRIASNSHLSIGTRLTIEMHFVQSKLPYYALGEVVWLKENKDTGVQKFDLGIKFLRVLSKVQVKNF